MASLQTRAIEEKDSYLINGQKIFTTEAHRTEYCWLLARTDPNMAQHWGLSMFIVDMNTPGVTVRPLINILGYQSFNEVFFNDVRVSKENMVGNKNEGWLLATKALEFERAPGSRVGRLVRILEELVEYTKFTKRNGHSLNKNPVIRQKLARMATEINICRLIGYHAVWMSANNISLTFEHSMSRVFDSELHARFADTAMQVLGLYSQLERESKWAQLRGKVERLYLSSRGRTLTGGTSEIQRNIIAVRGLSLPRR